MTNSKTTKKALLSSALALTMCVAMLIATTFAWFTDTASTSVNKIQAGTLKLKLEKATAWNTQSGNPTTWANANGGTLSFLQTDADGNVKESDAILWEPGCTYKLPELRISNEGNLALKYKIIISGIKGNAKLNDVITWTINNSDDESDATALAKTEYELKGKTTTPAAVEGGEATTNVDYDILTISGTMNKNAGNEYQGLSIDGIGITVIATQLASEFDSNNNTYDELAQYPVVAVSQVAVDKTNATTTAETTIESAQTVSDDNATPIATAKIPVGARTTSQGGADSTQLKLTINKAAVPANFTYNDAENDAATLEVKMEGLATDNTELITVAMYVGTGLKNFKLYHHDIAMIEAITINGVNDDQKYFYNSESGFVTMATKSFSPFTYTCKKDSWKDHAAADYATAVDTTKKIVTIASAEELALFAKNTGNYEGYTVNITQNIDLGAYLWEPMTVSDITIDGKSHTISNMLVRSCVDPSRYGAGFIGSTSGIAVKNLAFDGADVDFAEYIISNRAWLHCGNQGAVVVGRTYGSATFENVSVTNSTVYGYGKIGCLLGYAERSPVTFKSCVSKDNTLYGAYNIGGLAGHIQRINGVDRTTVEDCTVENITVDYNRYFNGENMGPETYIDLDDATATFKSNDMTNGEDKTRNVSGKYWYGYEVYYYGAYADYYVSYGNSAYDATVANYDNLKLANSEYCVNK